MFDRHGRCLLTPGHYELMLEQQVGDNLQLCKSSPKKNASWESIDTLKFDNVFKCIPVLKFSLNWNSENSNSCIERPRLRPLKPLDVVLANSASTKPKPQGLYTLSLTLGHIKHHLISFNPPIHPLWSSTLEMSCVSTTLHCRATCMLHPLCP